MSDEGFLSRWSRRKRAAEAGIPVEEPQAPPPPAEAVDAPAPAMPPKPEEPPFDLASLPSIESLTVESDFAAFLHKAVPESLRRAALRKAWALDPTIRDFVGLADYAWDYNAPDGVPGAALHLSGDVRQMVARLFADADGEGPPAKAQEPEPELEAPDLPVPADNETPAPIALAEAPDPGPTEEGPGSAVVRSEVSVPRRHGSALPS